MGIQFNKNRCRQPKIYFRRKKKYFHDPVRNKLVYVTPEEIIRQKVLKTLLDNGIPENATEVEKCLSCYDKDSRKRADIVINYPSGKPFAVIECKAVNVKIGDYCFNQAFEYAELMEADYIVVTNGKESFYFHYNREINEYESIIDLPYYEDMISGKYAIKRIPFDKLETRTFVYAGDSIGTATSFDLQMAMVNLLECLSDTQYSFPVRKCRYFRMIEDMGVSIRSYDDMTDSDRIFKNQYRSFKIDFEEKERIVSIGISGYSEKKKPNIRKTVINVAVDYDNVSRHILQLVVDDNLYILNDTVKFCHINSDENLKILIKENYPDIFRNNRIYLGGIPNDRLWNISDRDVSIVIENLISYALIIDKYINYSRAKKIRVSRSLSGAVRQFSYWVAHGTVGYPLLEGVDYISAMQEESSFMEQAYAIFMNNLELDENGNVLNYKYSEKRASQYIRSYFDKEYEVIPPFADWECALYPVSDKSYTGV